MHTNQNELTLADMQNHQRLTAQEISNLFNDATITARYYYANKWYIAKTNSFANGEIEGQNHVGAYNEGRWKVNDDDTFSVAWDGYWEDWTAFGYRVDNEWMFFDTTTRKWRLTLMKVEKGIFSTEITLEG